MATAEELMETIEKAVELDVPIARVILGEKKGHELVSLLVPNPGEFEVQPGVKSETEELLMAALSFIQMLGADKAWFLRPIGFVPLAEEEEAQDVKHGDMERPGSMEGFSLHSFTESETKRVATWVISRNDEGSPHAARVDPEEEDNGIWDELWRMAHDVSVEEGFTLPSLSEELDRAGFRALFTPEGVAIYQEALKFHTLVENQNDLFEGGYL